MSTNPSSSSTPASGGGGHPKTPRRPSPRFDPMRGTARIDQPPSIPLGLPDFPEMHRMGKEIARSIIQNNTLYGHHLASFHDLLTYGIPRIVTNYSPIVVMYAGKFMLKVVELSDPRYLRPWVQESDMRFRPLESRETHARKLTLSLTLIVDARYRAYVATPGHPNHYRLVEDTVHVAQKLFKLPVMDGSRATHDFDVLDPVRHNRFIGTMTINSHRKTVLIQMGLRHNYAFVTEKNKSSAVHFEVENRASDGRKTRSSSTLFMRMSRVPRGMIPTIKVKIPYITRAVPLTVMFRLFGVDRLEDMIELICAREAAAEREEGATGAHTSTFPFYARVRSIMCSDPGITDPQCQSLEASREDLMVWIALHCGGEQATGSSSTLGRRTRNSHIKSMRSLLLNEIFPHLEPGRDVPAARLKAEREVAQRRKVLLLAMNIRKLIKVSMGLLPADNRDDVVNMRCRTAGQSILLKLGQFFRTYVRSLEATLIRMMENETYIFLRDSMEFHGQAVSRMIRRNLATGNFSVNMQSGSTQSGVSQVVNSTNLLSRHDHSNALNKPMNRDGPQIGPRSLKPGDFGLIDPANSPDGRNIGLALHHTLVSWFRVGVQDELLFRLVRDFPGVHPISAGSGPCASTLLVINGKIFGSVADPVAAYEHLRLLRRRFVLPPDVSIVHDPMTRQLQVDADHGGELRPVFVLGRLRAALEIVERCAQFSPQEVLFECLTAGAVEYMSKDEEAHARVAVSLEQLVEEYARAEEEPLVAEALRCSPFTHVELDPSIAMFGVVPGCIPHLDCDQGPRLYYTAKMLKQAMAAMHPIFEEYQLDSQSNTLWYPQRPLLETVISDLTGVAHEPFGQHMIVCIKTEDSHNEEDALLVSQSSVQFGLGTTTKYSVMRDIERKPHNDYERFCDPTKLGVPVRGLRRGSYAALMKNGFPRKRARIEEGEVVIGKVTHYRETSRDAQGELVTRDMVADASQIWSGPGAAIVDKVISTETNGLRMVVVRLSQKHDLGPGDKLCSLHGQKGTIAYLVPREDLPFTAEGITPDLVISLFGIIKRMTIGMIKEMVQAKLATLVGEIQDATPFRGLSFETLLGQLRNIDYGRGGMTMMYSGRTGEPIGECFMGPSNYLVLRHQAFKKVKARAKGKVTPTFRQPPNKKQNVQGLRYGGMELLTTASLGAAQVIHRTFLDNSDRHDFHLCNRCGEIAVEADPRDVNDFRVPSEGEEGLRLRDQPECPKCKRSDRIIRTAMSYPMIIFIKQAKAMGMNFNCFTRRPDASFRDSLEAPEPLDFKEDEEEEEGEGEGEGEEEKAN